MSAVIIEALYSLDQQILKYHSQCQQHSNSMSLRCKLSKPMSARRKKGRIMADLSLVAEQEWSAANRRALVIRPLIEFEHCPREKAHEAAAELELSERQIYRLIQRLREFGGELTALLTKGSNGGRGKRRLAAPREALLHRLIAAVFITPQKRSVADLIRAIRSQSLKDRLDPPSDGVLEQMTLERIWARQSEEVASMHHKYRSKT